MLPSTCVLPDGFQLDSEYPVCKYMNKYLKEFFSSARVLLQDIDVEDTGRKCGRKKIFFFKNEPVEKKGTKKRKMVPESSEDHLTEEGDAQKKVSKKKTHKKKFFEDVLAGAEKYRRSYRELGDRQRVERVEQLAKDVMSVCINQKAARDSDEQFIKK